MTDIVEGNTGRWNFQVILQSFQQRDIEEILKIPLCTDLGEDEIMWKLSKDGCFSVKSAYYYIMESMMDINSLHVSRSWKALWHLPIPNKVLVCVFLWRVVRECLPTRL